MITGIDIVREQLKIAAGEPFTLQQSDIKIRGHAIECRINAEDPRNFMPCPGTINHFHAPGGPGIRVDSHIYSSYTVPPFYDSLIAKIIAHGDNRDIALSRMRNALNETVVDGIKTNLPLHQEFLRASDFQQGMVNIHYLESWLNL